MNPHLRAMGYVKVQPIGATGPYFGPLVSKDTGEMTMMTMKKHHG